MNSRTITGEEEFQVQAKAFCIGPSYSGYTLQISCDRVTWTNTDTVAASVNWPVHSEIDGLWFRLKNNPSNKTALIIW